MGKGFSDEVIVVVKRTAVDDAGDCQRLNSPEVLFCGQLDFKLQTPGTLIKVLLCCQTVISFLCCGSV